MIPDLGIVVMTMHVIYFLPVTCFSLVALVTSSVCEAEFDVGLVPCQQRCLDSHKPQLPQRFMRIEASGR